MCHDYTVRFACCRECPSGQPATWTDWVNRDRPGGTGDWQHVPTLYEEGLIPCPNPIGIVCETTDGIPASNTQDILTVSSEKGCICIN